MDSSIELWSQPTNGTRITHFEMPMHDYVFFAHVVVLGAEPNRPHRARLIHLPVQMASKEEVAGRAREDKARAEKANTLTEHEYAEFLLERPRKVLVDERVIAGKDGVIREFFECTLLLPGGFHAIGLLIGDSDVPLARAHFLVGPPQSA